MLPLTVEIDPMRTDQRASSADKDSANAGVGARAAQHSLIWHVSPDLLGTLNSQGYFETSNPAWMTVLGWTAAEVASMSIFELLHPDDVERTREGFNLTQQGQPAIQFPNRYRCKDGTYRWISWMGVPEDGMVFCSGRDITAEAEQAEQLAVALRERDTAWATSQDLLVVAALDGTFTAVNTAWTKVLGWMEDELIGRAFPELTHPDDLANTLAVFASISQAPLSTPYEYRLRHKDGSYRWFAWTAALAGESVYGNGRDTTAHRESTAAVRAAEVALQDSLAFLTETGAVARAMREADWSASTLGHPRQWPQSLRSVVNLVLGSAFPMFVSWGPQLATVYNDGYAAILGEKHPAALGQPFLEVWSEIRSELEPLVARPMAGESFFIENLPFRLRRHGFDEDTWFTFSFSSLRQEDGQIAGLYCACVETTKAVLAQQQLRAREEWLQSLFHQAPGFATVLRGPNYRFDMVNQAYLDITGNRPLLGRTVAEALPEAFAQVSGWLDDVYATGEPFVGHAVPMTVDQGEGKAPYDAIIDFMYQPLRDAHGQVEGIFVQGHDVTEQHRSQQALRAFPTASRPSPGWPRRMGFWSVLTRSITTTPAQAMSKPWAGAGSIAYTRTIYQRRARFGNALGAAARLGKSSTGCGATTACIDGSLLEPHLSSTLPAPRSAGSEPRPTSRMPGKPPSHCRTLTSRTTSSWRHWRTNCATPWHLSEPLFACSLSRRRTNRSVRMPRQSSGARWATCHACWTTCWTWRASPSASWC